MLGELIDLIGSIGFGADSDHGADDILGRVYEYFLGMFAGAEKGKDGGEFYTPRSVVYPPDKREQAVQLVIKQAERLASEDRD